MRITFWGAAGTVTGSRFVVEAAGRRTLRDELGWDPTVAEHGHSVDLARSSARVRSGG